MGSVSFSDDEQHAVDAIARKRGYDAAIDYLKALVLSDVKAHGEPSPFEEIDDRSLDEIRAGIKESVKQALRGETVPLEALWSDDDT